MLMIPELIRIISQTPVFINGVEHRYGYYVLQHTNEDYIIHHETGALHDFGTYLSLIKEFKEENKELHNIFFEKYVEYLI